MKIWRLYCDANKYLGYWVDNESILEDIKNKLNTGEMISDWEAIQIEKGDENSEIIGDISQCWSYSGIIFVSEKVKTILENIYSDELQFLEVFDEEDNKLYIMNILKYVEGIDYEKSKLHIVGGKYIVGVDEYVFLDIVKQIPIFKLNLKGFRWNMAIFISDDFKKLLQDNKVTGVLFEELYEFN
ncbi:imm11 family protein [Clostridium paraputrificum]|uniref:imm11 family protein n=1 Tax=Clostridium paraputrificum TaxID=29363 RepID=UPI000C078A98|nr:DUF1629 domain-containing protein [Clostridium paraputrificum]MDB2099263.1 hypothetical protein [Clostridium paraputrificum]